MDQIESEVIAILRNVLGEPATRHLRLDSALLGSVAEIDSMAVVAILTLVSLAYIALLGDPGSPDRGPGQAGSRAGGEETGS